MSDVNLETVKEITKTIRELNPDRNWLIGNKQPRSKTAGYFAPFMKTHHFMVPINSLKRGKPRGNALRDYKDKDGSDNYNDIKMNISRYFSNDITFLDKIINKESCEELE